MDLADGIFQRHQQLMAQAWCSSARGTSLPAPCGVLCGGKAVLVPWAAVQLLVVSI